MVFSLRPASSRLSALALGALVSASILAAPATAAQFSASQKAEIGSIVRGYLMENPEILREVMQELDRKDKALESARRESAMRSKADVLFNSPYGEVIGNPEGKATLVEFFDYNCGYCKRALDDLSKLMKTEPELRVVLKDFPVLGPGSVEAAEVAGAVRSQLKGDKFWQFHYKLLSSHGQIGKAQAMAAAQDSGVDMSQLAIDMAKPEVRAGIQQNMELADALSLTGTPSYVIGSDIVVGAVGYDQLKEKVDSVLKCGKPNCS